MNQVELCPDLQSPDIDVPCTTATTLPAGPDIDQLPFTGSAWIDLILGIAVGLVVAGFVFLYWRRSRAEVESE